MTQLQLPLSAHLGEGRTSRRLSSSSRVVDPFVRKVSDVFTAYSLINIMEKLSHHCLENTIFRILLDHFCDNCVIFKINPS